MTNADTVKPNAAPGAAPRLHFPTAKNGPEPNGEHFSISKGPNTVQLVVHSPSRQFVKLTVLSSHSRNWLPENAGARAQTPI